MRHWVVATGLLLTAVVMAGCTGMPFGEPTPQEEPAPVKMVNNATVTERFEVAVVDVGANLTVTMADGRVFNKSISQGSSTHTTTKEVQIESVQFPDSANIIGRYTLEPGESKQIEVEKVAPDQAIVVLVYDKPEGTYRSIKSLSCGGPILGYQVTSQKGGSEDWTWSKHGCGFS